MLNVSNEIKKLYKKDSIDKYFFATFRDLGIAKGNSDIISESLSITESVCSGSKLKLGLCEASNIQLSLYLEENVTGDEMTVFEVLGKFEPEISVDETKGIVFEGDDISVLYEGSLSDIGDSTTVFDGEKNYLLIGKILCDDTSTFIYTLMGQDKNAIYYMPLDVSLNSYINICIPIIGSDFDLYTFKFYSNNTIMGHFTLYELNHPIMPLGLYHIDSAKKSHNNAAVRDIVGYDRLAISDLDEQVQYSFTSDVNVNDFMSDVLADSPINIGLGVEAGQIDGYVEPYEVVDKDLTDLQIQDPAYRFHANEIVTHASGTFTKLDDVYGAMPSIEPNPDPSFDGYGILYSGKIQIKPTVMAGKANAPVSDDERFCIPLGWDTVGHAGRIKSECKVSREQAGVHGNVKAPQGTAIDGLIGYRSYTVLPRDIASQVYDDYWNHLQRWKVPTARGGDAYEEYWDDYPYAGWYKWIFCILRTLRNAEDLTINPDCDYIYHWPQDEILELQRVLSASYNLDMWTNVTLYGVEYNPEAGGGVWLDTLPISVVKPNTYLEYFYYYSFTYTWDIDIPFGAEYRNFTYKRQADYDAGKITYEELVMGGAEVDIVVPETTYSWYLDIYATALHCNLTNYDRNKTYLVYYESLYTNAAYLLSELAYTEASSMIGEFLVNNHEAILTTINNNTTSLVEFDVDGNFDLSYISKAHLICINERLNTTIQDETVVSAYPIRYVVRKRDQGNLIFYTLPISENPLQFSVYRRYIVESYLELNGDFLHMNRFGVSSLLQIQPSYLYTNIKYVADEFELTQEDKDIPDILPDIEFVGDMAILQSEFTLESSSESTLPLTDVRYEQRKTYKLDKDLELVSSTESEISLEGHVYTVGDVYVDEVVTAVHNIYRLEVDTQETYDTNIETDKGSIIDFESSVKSMISQLGTLDVDRQSSLLTLINNYDEKVNVSYQTVDNTDYIVAEVWYIKSIGYQSNSEDIGEGDYTADNIVFSIVGPNIFNNAAIFVNADERCYASVTLHDNEYSLELDELPINYNFNVEHDISSLHTLVSDTKSSVSSRGELIVDRQSYLDNLIDNYNENVTISQSSNIITVRTNYIDSMEFVSYKGYDDLPIYQKYRSRCDIPDVFYLTYEGEYVSNPVYANVRYKYYVDVEFVIEKRKLPVNGTYEVTCYYNEMSAVKSSVQAYLDSIHTSVLSDAGSLTVDRHTDFVNAVMDLIDDRYSVSESEGFLFISKIASITCRRVGAHPSMVTILMQSSDFTEYLNYVNILSTTFNAEDVSVPLVRSLYLDDATLGTYGGVLITKSKPSNNESFYPFYYNADGTVGKQSGVRYYKVENNLFIESFVFDAVQLTMLARDIFESLVNVDPYNLECTYKALPYTEVCDKVCVEGVDWSSNENPKYFTSIFRRTIQGNIGMTDHIEMEFEE